jgi:hypothetical protein
MLRSGLLAFTSFVGVLMVWSVYDIVYAARRQYAMGVGMFLGRWTTPSTLLIALVVAISVFILTRHFA